MSAPAGWYPDPQDPRGQRYWDGAAWTEHTAAGAPAAAASAAAAPAYGYAPAVGAPAAVHRKFGFGESVRRGFQRWTNYRDRATPGEYWWFYLFAGVAALVAYVPLVIALFVMLGTADKTPTTRIRNGVTYETTELHPTTAGITAVVIAGIVFFLVWLILFFPQLALSVRRLHDTDKSCWWLLLAFVPFGSLILLVFFVLTGTPGQNRWGPPVTS